MDGKLCRECHVIKPLSEFHKQKTTISGYRNPCKDCRRDRRKYMIGKKKCKQCKNIYIIDNFELTYGDIRSTICNNCVEMNDKKINESENITPDTYGEIINKTENIALNEDINKAENITPEIKEESPESTN